MTPIPNADGNGREEFFLPVLCQPESLLRLVLLAELLVLVLVLAEPMDTGFDWLRLALTSLFVQWVVLLSAGLLCALRPLLARLPVAPSSGLCALLVLLLTLGCTALADLYALQGDLNTSGGRYLRHAAISLIMSGLMLRYFYLRHQWQLRSQAQLQARIDLLQARIRPHFLFNSLNSIACLIMSDPPRAEQAVLNLSDLFRASLGNRASGLVSWLEDLQLARQYLAMESLRLGERLRVVWQLEGVPPELQIPQLTLQPLLENAVKHGIAQRAAGGVIEVKAWVDAGMFHLQVSNPLPHRGGGTIPKKGAGQGLSIIGERLSALFGPKARLQVEEHDDRYYTSLEYPCSSDHQQEVGSL